MYLNNLSMELLDASKTFTDSNVRWLSQRGKQCTWGQILVHIATQAIFDRPSIYLQASCINCWAYFRSIYLKCTFTWAYSFRNCFFCSIQSQQTVMVQFALMRVDGFYCIPTQHEKCISLRVPSPRIDQTFNLISKCKEPKAYVLIEISFIV